MYHLRLIFTIDLIQVFDIVLCPQFTHLSFTVTVYLHIIEYTVKLETDTNTKTYISINQNPRYTFTLVAMAIANEKVHKKACLFISSKILLLQSLNFVSIFCTSHGFLCENIEDRMNTPPFQSMFIIEIQWGCKLETFV